MKSGKHWFAAPFGEIPGVEVHGIGIREKMPPGIIHRPHGSGDYLFMLYYDPVELGAGEAPRAYDAGAAILWTPGTCQHYGHARRRFTHTWLHADGDVFAAQAAALPRNTPFEFPEPSAAERWLDMLQREMSAHAPPDATIARNLVENLVREILRQASQATTPRAPPALLRVRRFMEANCTQPLRLAELAEMAHCSTPHFSAEFKRHFGVPPIELLLRLRMKQAEYLLQDRNLQVGEVARRVGYRDLYYFSKLFKQRTGTSPSRWRKRCHGDGRRREGRKNAFVCPGAG